MGILYCEADDPRLRVYGKMTDTQLRLCATSRSGDKTGAFDDYADGLFVSESRNVAMRALDAGYHVVSLFMEQKWLEHEMPLVQRVLELDERIPVLVGTRACFRAITGYEVTRGSLAAFRRKPLPSVPEVLAQAKRVVVLEDVTNYANMGALFRSAAALAVDAVLVTPRCHDPFYRRTARVSMGAVFQVPWTRIENLFDGGIALLHTCGFDVAAMALSQDALSLQDTRLKTCPKLALVMGTEGEGLCSQTIEQSDYVVRIPMTHGVDSLNVSVAAGIAFWELCAKSA